MASINLHHFNKEEETSFRIVETAARKWVEIKRGDDIITIFFSDEDALNRLLGLIQTEIYAYQREKG